RPRFVDRPRREGGGVAEGDCLIDVVQPGRSARCIQRPGAARIARARVVQAVANAEQVLVAELVVDLGQEVGRVNRIRIDAGRDRRAWIADGSEPGVYRADVVGRATGRERRATDRGEARLVELSLLEVRKVEGAIAGDRAAEARAVLVLVHRQ